MSGPMRGPRPYPNDFLERYFPPRGLQGDGDQVTMAAPEPVPHVTPGINPPDNAGGRGHSVPVEPYVQPLRPAQQVDGDDGA